MTKLKIVITCYKYSYFFAKINIASIRFFYPEVEIYLIKDNSCGRFSTVEVEKYFRCKILDLGIQNYGLGSAKILFLLTKRFGNHPYLILDSDIIFAGPVLERLEKELLSTDFIVSPEWKGKRPKNAYFSRLYYSYKEASTHFPGFHYPGYVFNCGQLVGTPGLVHKAAVLPFFDIQNYPYWKRNPTPYSVNYDQGLLNILLPSLANQNTIRLKAVPFMRWSESEEVRNSVKLEHIKRGTYDFLIHWATPDKSSNIWSKTRADILDFFLKVYYEHVPLGRHRYLFNKVYLQFQERI